MSTDRKKNVVDTEYKFLRFSDTIINIINKETEIISTFIQRQKIKNNEFIDLQALFSLSVLTISFFFFFLGYPNPSELPSIEDFEELGII